MASISEIQRNDITALFQKKLELRNELAQAKTKLDAGQGEYEVADKQVSGWDTVEFWKDSPAEVTRDALEVVVQKDENVVKTLTNSYENTAKSLVETTIAVSGDPKISSLKATRDSIAALMGPLNQTRDAISANERATAAAAANAQNLAISQVNRAQPRTDAMGKTIQPDNSFNNLIGAMAVTGTVVSTVGALDARTQALAAAAQFNTAAAKIPELNGVGFSDTANLGTVKGQLGGMYSTVGTALSAANTELSSYVESVASKIAVTD